MHDYLYDDSTPDKHTTYNPEITVENTYKGSVVYVTVPFLLNYFSSSCRPQAASRVVSDQRPR